MVENFLLCSGLLFPVLSWMSCIYGALVYRLSGVRSSAIMIPLIGPILLTAWLVVAGHSLLTIPLVWVLDLGTMMFVFVLPELVRDWWKYSSFTRLATLRGAKDHSIATITIHQNGHSLLQISWGDPEQRSMISCPGQYADDGETVRLQFASGRTIHLRRINLHQYEASELEDSEEFSDSHSLSEWTFSSLDRGAC